MKAGLLEPARALFAALAPRMPGRPDADAFARDLADRAGRIGEVAAAKLPPAPPPDVGARAQRSRRLRVLP